MWCVPDLTPDFIERMEDLLDLYEKPYSDAEPVFCLDEKPIQLLTDARPPQVTSNGTRRRDYEYVRRGTANIFCGVEPLGGLHLSKVTPTRSGEEFAWMLVDIAASYPEAKVIHLVMDNLSTHREKSVTDVFGPVDGGRLWQRFCVHYTPKHGSWLNQAEIEISLISRECLKNRRFGNLDDLRRETMAWSAEATRRGRRFSWRFTTRDARRRLKYRRRLRSSG